MIVGMFPSFLSPYIADKLPLILGIGERIADYIESNKIIVNLCAAYSLIFPSDSGVTGCR